jgi:hypothetical protein
MYSNNRVFLESSTLIKKNPDFVFLPFSANNELYIKLIVRDSSQIRRAAVKTTAIEDC